MLFYREKLLSNGQLKRLGEHQYNVENIGLLDPFLQPFWNFLTSKTPLWLAPNLITVTGLLVNIVTSLILAYYSPDAITEPPRWACFLCALGLFIYQSLDAIDGKQARRTGTSTPLGELFDHGCDSISTVFVALSACISVQLGKHPTWMFFQCFCAMALFYCAHWQTYVSGTMKFGKVDVTEAQCTIIVIHLISAVFGPSIWATEFTFPCYWELRYLIAVTTILCCSVNFYDVLTVVMTGGVGKNGSTVAVAALGVELTVVLFTMTLVIYLALAHEKGRVIIKGGVGKNGSTVAGTSVLSPIIPYFMVIVPAYIIYKKSEKHLYESHPALYILAFGIVSAKVTNRLVVAHMTRNELNYLDTVLVGPAMLFLNQYFNFFFNEYYVLWACLMWVTVDLLRYSYVICREICDHLKIELFRIPYPNIGVGGVNGLPGQGLSDGVRRSSRLAQLHSKDGSEASEALLISLETQS